MKWAEVTVCALFQLMFPRSGVVSYLMYGASNAAAADLGIRFNLCTNP